MRSRSVFSIDVALILATLLLMVIGILFIYSSGVTSSGVIYSNEYKKQIVWVFLGLFLMLGAGFLDYTRLRNWSPAIYLGLIGLLVLTLMFGKVVNGARSWIGIWILGIQPSEFMKLGLILFLAWYLERVGDRITELPILLGGLVIAMAPVMAIMLQPDLGSAMVFIPVFLFMSFMAGARLHHLMFLIGTGSLTILFGVLPAWEHYIAGRDVPILSVLQERQLIEYAFMALFLILALALVGYFWAKRRYFFWIIYTDLMLILSFVGSLGVRKVLKEYQMMRLIMFLDPGVDPKGAGWNIIQSITAVGSGGLAGKGFLKGTQSHYRYLPQQSTDFIFSIIAEEWGFIGGLVIFLAFLLILFRGIRIMAYSKDSFGVSIAAGITGMLFFHLIVNVGMAIGIMPITGIPLFFLSYGGSSLWTALIGIGLLLSIYTRRYR